MPSTTPRWIAQPPPGLGPAGRARRVRGPYQGPPGYGPYHPGWGFPPIIRPLEDDSPDAPVGGVWGARARSTRFPQASSSLTAAPVLAACTAVACLVAAGAEVRRFALLLRGRAQVLSAATIDRNDVVVTGAGLAALALGIATALVTMIAIVGLHRAAALRHGQRPARSVGAMVARLAVPGWNLAGAGQVMVETQWTVERASMDAEEAAVERSARAARHTVVWWWILWVGNGLVAAIVAGMTIYQAVAPSAQLEANLVEMHLVLDASAGLVAIVTAVLMESLRRMWCRHIPRRQARLIDAIARPVAPRSG